MSVLQCPATLLIVRADPGPENLLAMVHRVVEQVRGRRVAAVYSSRMVAAVEAADLAAAELGLRRAVIEELEELGFTEAIDEIADVHRGETVLVFTHGDGLGQAIPFAAERSVSSDGVLEMEVDGDGWRPAAPRPHHHLDSGG